jgi:hypothetical protein
VKRESRRSFEGSSSWLTRASVIFTLRNNSWAGSVNGAMFEIVGDITNVQVIATGRGIRRLMLPFD